MVENTKNDTSKLAEEETVEQPVSASQDSQTTPQKDAEDDHVDAGESLLSWETWETLPLERGPRWYIIASLIGGLLIAYGLFTSNPLFSLIILMIGVMMFVNGAKHPDRVAIHLTTTGIVVGDHYYPYEEIKDFSLVYRPPYASILYIDFNSWTTPVRRIDLEQINPLAVREILLPVLPENYEREDELLTDLVKRVYKL